MEVERNDYLYNYYLPTVELIDAIECNQVNDPDCRVERDAKDIRLCFMVEGEIVHQKLPIEIYEWVKEHKEVLRLSEQLSD